MGLKLKTLYTLLKDYRKEKIRYKDSPIKLYNFYGINSIDEVWLYRFIVNQFAGSLSLKNEIALFSVYGRRPKIKLNRSKHKIFFTSENLSIFPEYRDYCVDEVDLALGFEYLHNKNYLRFPLWMVYFIPAVYDYGTINKAVYNLSHFEYAKSPNRKFCSLVSSHDDNGMRTQLFNALSTIDTIACGGAFLQNTNELKEVFNDDKQLFLARYKFNICPENSNCEGYVTEKVFHAINTGAIPIYWGSNNNPEPEVLNKDAILFYSGPESLDKLKATVLELHTNDKLYQEFIAQERFLPTATEYIWDMLSDVNDKLKKIIVNH